MAAVALLIGALVLVACSRGGSDAPEATPTVVATSTATPEVSATPAPIPTSTPTPRPLALYPPLAVGAPIELPDNVTLYVWSGCTQCDSHSTALRRVERSGATTEVTSIFEGTINSPYIDSAWVTPTEVYLFECVGYCGGGVAFGESIAELHRSGDGGRTWESLGTRPVTTPPTASDWGVTPPLKATPSRSDGVWDIDGVHLDVRAIDPRGGPEAYSAYLFDVDAAGRVAIRWQVELGPNRTFSYISVLNTDGTALATFEASYGSPVYWLAADRLVATMVYGPRELYQSPGIDYGWIPSIIDMRDGTVRPIVNPFGADLRNRNTVAGLQVR